MSPKLVCSFTGSTPVSYKVWYSMCLLWIKWCGFYSKVYRYWLCGDNWSVHGMHYQFTIKTKSLVWHDRNIVFLWLNSRCWWW